MRMMRTSFDRYKSRNTTLEVFRHYRNWKKTTKNNSNNYLEANEDANETTRRECPVKLDTLHNSCKINEKNIHFVIWMS